MSGVNEHVFAHPRTGVFWFRRVVPARLRPVLGEVAGFPAKPGRRELTISLRTKDRREAHLRAGGYAQAVATALARAEALAPKRIPAPPGPLLVRPQAAFAAIRNWQQAEIGRRELRHFNGRADDPALALAINAAMDRALFEALASGCDWPDGFDASLAAALASEGLPVPADHPVVARLRRPFAEALRAVLQAEQDMLGGLWDGGREHRPAPPSAPPSASPGSATPFLEHVEAWAAQLGMKPRQAGEYRADVIRFAERRPDLTVAGVEKRHARDWVKALAEQGRAEATIIRKLSALRSYWRYLQAEGVVGEDHTPFAKVTLPGSVTGRRVAPEDKRQPFAKADVVKLWRAALADDHDQPLADLIRLAAYTGARIESLCQLTAARVQVDPETGIRFLQFSDKTEAGVRQVPVHPALASLVDRRLHDCGYLIAVRAARKGGERSVGIGKRFGRLKTRLGYGPQQVFHSIRKTTATLLENARCPESTAADLLGHDKPTMTYGLYSGGTDLREKQHWVGRLDYDDAEFAEAT